MPDLLLIAVIEAAHCPVSRPQLAKIIRMLVVKTQPLGLPTLKLKAKTLLQKMFTVEIIRLNVIKSCSDMGRSGGCRLQKSQCSWCVFSCL